jgi:hypothetical protein
MVNLYAKKLGVCSSIFSAFFTFFFGLFVLFNNQVIYFTLVLLLSLSVILMVIAMEAFISQGKKVFANCAIAFSIMYAVLVDIVYYTQISVVRMGTLSNEQLTIVSDFPGTVFFYLDMLGYCFLCMATLFIAFSVNRSYRLLRVFLFIHSSLVIPTFLLPFLPFTFNTNKTSGNLSGALILILWCMIFTPVCLLMTKYFLKQKNN